MTWQKNLDQPFITVTLATVELVAPSESVTVNLDIKISQCLHDELLVHIFQKNSILKIDYLEKNIFFKVFSA